MYLITPFNVISFFFFSNCLVLTSRAERLSLYHLFIEKAINVLTRLANLGLHFNNTIPPSILNVFTKTRIGLPKYRFC